MIHIWPHQLSAKRGDRSEPIFFHFFLIEKQPIQKWIGQEGQGKLTNPHILTTKALKSINIPIKTDDDLGWWIHSMKSCCPWQLWSIIPRPMKHSVTTLEPLHALLVELWLGDDCIHHRAAIEASITSKVPQFRGVLWCPFLLWLIFLHSQQQCFLLVLNVECFNEEQIW